MPTHLGLHHVALHCVALEACVQFYTELFHMNIEWQPDPDNVYLTSGNDNFALHRAPQGYEVKGGTLDHVGFILPTPECVDEWYDYLKQHDVEIVKLPKTHRDGARSFYCKDPDGRLVQLIYHPPLASLQLS